MENKHLESERRTRELGEKPIRELLLKFSIPSIVGMLVQALYGAVDQIFVGKYVGSLAVGAVATMMPMTFIHAAFSMLLGIGGNAIVSIKLGKQKKKEADKVCGNTIGFSFIIGSLLAVFAFIYADKLPFLFGASKANFHYARDYLSVVLLGYPFAMISYTMNGYIRGEGNPKKAMFTLLIGAIINIFLDYYCVKVLNLGVKGAAVATVISQIISMTWVLSYFFRRESNLVVDKNSMKLEFDILIQMIKMGFSPFMMQLVASMVTSLTTHSLLHYGGDEAVSAMAIISSFSGVIFMPVIGVNHGSQPIIGYNYGAEKYDRVKQTYWNALVFSTIICTIGFIFSEFFPRAIFKLYLSENPNLETFLDFAAPANQIYNSMFFLVGVGTVGSGYFQSIGKPSISLLLSMSRQLIFFLPMLLILPKFFGMWGVFLAMPFSDTLSSLLAFYLVKKDFKNYELLEANNV